MARNWLDDGDENDVSCFVPASVPQFHEVLREFSTRLGTQLLNVAGEVLENTSDEPCRIDSKVQTRDLDYLAALVGKQGGSFGEAGMEQSTPNGLPHPRYRFGWSFWEDSASTGLEPIPDLTVWC